MNIFIVDDVIGVVKTLQNIVEKNRLGSVVGYTTNAMKATEEILRLKPQLVMIDLLMDGMDGIDVVNQVKEKDSSISFIMISKVQDKEMVERAYNAGVEFFISKPINVIEVQRVIGHVSEKLRMNQIVSQIGMLISDDKLKEKEAYSDEPTDDVDNVNGLSRGEAEELKKTEKAIHNTVDTIAGNREIERLMGLLGMMGEKGTRDILEVCNIIDQQGGVYAKEAIEKVAEMRNDSVRNIEQRIRRAIKRGLTNVAAVGIDDFNNEVFQIYANYVYDFKSIKDEMDKLKGLNSNGGRVNIPKFIEGLYLYKNTKIG